MPKGTSCCSACTSSRSTSAPVLMAPEHQPVVHHEGLAGPGGWWQQLQSYPSRCWARRGGSSMCPDRLILYTKCALLCLQGLSGQNHVGIPVRAHRGCALTCALKNRAYGASVPAGGVCLQGQFYGTKVYIGLPNDSCMRAPAAMQRVTPLRSCCNYLMLGCHEHWRAGTAARSARAATRGTFRHVPAAA